MSTTHSTFGLILSTILACFTFISSLIRIPIGPVPFTLQTVFVILAGLLLSPTYAALSQILNFLLMTVFIYGTSIFTIPTCGFLLGFIVIAWFLSLMKEYFLPIQLLLSEIILYLIGLCYLWYVTFHLTGTSLQFMKIMKIGFLPFILPDIMKIILTLIIYHRIKPIFLKMTSHR